jgi:tRNA A-37 threonylcarbamoyl transferase component Bud32
MENFIKREDTRLIIRDVIEDNDCTVLKDKPKRVFTVRSNVIDKGSTSDIYETCEKDECHYIAKVIKKIKDSKEPNFLNEALCQIKAAKLGLAAMIYEVWNCKDTIMLIMDKIPGETLEIYLSKTTIDDNTKRHIVQKAFMALDELHQIGMIHGDSHMNNFMVEGNDIFFIDFGDSILVHTLSFKVDFKKLTDNDFKVLQDDIESTFPGKRYTMKPTSLPTQPNVKTNVKTNVKSSMNDILQHEKANIQRGVEAIEEDGDFFDLEQLVELIERTLTNLNAEERKRVLELVKIRNDIS